MIILGRKYRHYKGGVYTVLLLAVSTKDGYNEEVVVYRAEKDGSVWTRPVTEWNEKVRLPLLGEYIPRFMLMEE